MFLGSRIKEQRERLGWKVPRLAKRLTELYGEPVSQQVIAQNEGKELCAPWFFLELPTALGTTMEYLSGKTDDPSVKDCETKNKENTHSEDQKGSSLEVELDLIEVIKQLGRLEARIEALEAGKGGRRPEPPEKKRTRKGPLSGRRT